MSAQRLLEDVRAAGLSIEVDGPDLIVEADHDPPPELIDELRRHKAELIAFLKPPSQRARVPPVQDDTANLDERAALIEYGAGVPREWAEGYAALSTMPTPSGYSPERWRRIIDAAGAFLDKWAATAIECGWSDLDVFGCNPDRPDRRFDAMGLVLLLDRCEVVGLDESGADLVTETGACQRFYRRRLPSDTVRLWKLADKQRGGDAG